MTNVSKIALIAFAAVIAGTTFAAAKTTPPQRHPHDTTHPNYGVECRVHGDNFYVINWGNAVLDSGLQIAWGSPTTDDSGVILLPKMLAPGEEVKLADLLSDIVIPGSPCNVDIV